MGYYVHEVPGRLRIKIPSLKNNSREAGNVRRLLEDFSGVTSASVNTVTGSVVVGFDPRALTSQGILHALAQHRYIDLREAIGSASAPKDPMVQMGAALSKVAVGLVLDRAFGGTPLSLLTALI